MQPKKKMTILEFLAYHSQDTSKPELTPEQFKMDAKVFSSSDPIMNPSICGYVNFVPVLGHNSLIIDYSMPTGEKPIDNAPEGVKEARKKFETEMMLADPSAKIKRYTPDDVAGIELLIRDDELYRRKDAADEKCSDDSRGS